MGKGLGNLMNLRSAGELASMKQLMARRGSSCTAKSLGPSVGKQKNQAHSQGDPWHMVSSLLGTFSPSSQVEKRPCDQGQSKHPLNTCCVCVPPHAGCWMLSPECGQVSSQPRGCEHGLFATWLLLRLPGPGPTCTVGNFLQKNVCCSQHPVACGGAGQAWPGCVDITNGAQVETMMSAGNIALC